MLEKYYIDITYNSMRLEGIHISIANIIDLLNEIDTVQIKDIDKMISKNFINSLSYINSQINKNFDKYELLDITKMVNFYTMKTLHSNAGQIRANHIKVVGSNYTPEVKTEHEIRNEIFENLENFLKEPLKYYCYVTRNQIFMDGNKRTALLMANLLLQIKNQNECFYIPIEEKPEFTKRLVEYYESNIEDEFIKYLRNFVKNDKYTTEEKLSWE